MILDKVETFIEETVTWSWISFLKLCLGTHPGIIIGDRIYRGADGGFQESDVRTKMSEERCKNVARKISDDMLETAFADLY